MLRDRERMTVDLYRKRSGGRGFGEMAKAEADRFGSSRKKEAAGAACWMLLPMGFEC
jgi:hypothetical protein